MLNFTAARRDRAARPPARGRSVVVRGGGPRGARRFRGAALAAARRWLEARATPRPVAALFEDVQWADAASRELLESLADGLDDVPVLVVTFAREGEPAPRAAEVITLAPLDDANAAELARALAPAASDEAIADLVARAAGNPFFVEELARDLGERGAAAAQVNTTATFTPLPATVEAAVQARLDRLPAAAREVASAAAAVGRWFWREAVARALPRPLGDAELDDALGELERRGLIARSRPRWSTTIAIDSRRAWCATSRINA